MKLNEIREFIYKYLMQNIQHENIVFDNQKAQEIDTTKHHIKLSFDDIKKELLEIGGDSSMITGTCMFVIYTPEGFGLSKCFHIIDEITELFFNKRIDGFFFGNLELKNNGQNDNFYSFNVSINFEYEVF